MAEPKGRGPRPPFEEAWRQRFIKFSAHDDDAGIAGWSASGLGARFRHFMRVWPGDKADALWLDVGCGAGTYTRYLAENGIKVIGMDYSYPTIVKARARAATGGAWSIADAARLPVAPAAFDGAMCFGVLQALEDSTAVLEELARAVKPGGQIWVDALNRWCLPSLWKQWRRRLKGLQPHLRYESPSRLRRLMKAQGCETVRLYWVPILPQGLQRYQRILETPAIRWMLHRIPFAGVFVSHAIVIQGIKAHTVEPHRY